MSDSTARIARAASWVLGVACTVITLAGAASAWTSLPAASDPLIRLPGTQPADGVVLEPGTSCMFCHDSFDASIDQGSHWQGSMMAQAARDPIFWAALTVTAQDSIWAVGRPNASDLCLRCHSPTGWLGGRSDPTNGSALANEDFDGVSCASCHRLYDPFFEDTYAGLRDGADWTGYWDEAEASGTESSIAASATLLADQLEASSAAFFNGNAFYDGAYQPVAPGWSDSGGGQYFAAAAPELRASFADTTATHPVHYSRYHKSRFFCASCHDVSNAVLPNLPFAATVPGDGTTVLPSESQPAHAYGHIERTFAEFMLSDYSVGGGADGKGPFAPALYTTSRPNNQIASCQDCHLQDRVGKGSILPSPIRPTESLEHPKSGQPWHDLTGGNMWVPYLLASTVPSSPNYDAVNEQLLAQGPATLTIDLAAGDGLDPAALLAGVSRAQANLQNAATISDLAYDELSGSLTFRIHNNTGHKLISGFPEGRRMFVNVRVLAGGSLVHEVNPYDSGAATLKGLPSSYSPSSPPLGAGEFYDEQLVYEVKMSSTLTGESSTFHIALATERYKDNRIPPLGFRSGEAAARLSEPVWAGTSAPAYFTPAEYAGGYDEVQLTVPPGADIIEVNLYYQTTSREYMEFLRDEIDGTATTLISPTPSGEPNAYIAQSDPFFAQLAAWGTTLWQLWDHNRDVLGAAPVLMTQQVVDYSGGGGGQGGGGGAGGAGGLTGGGGSGAQGGQGGSLPGGSGGVGGNGGAAPPPPPPPEDDDGGCGCRTAPATTQASWLLLLAPLVLARRRRGGAPRDLVATSRAPRRIAGSRSSARR